MKNTIDKTFVPMYLKLNEFKAEVKKHGGKKLVLEVERNAGFNYIYEIDIFKDDVLQSYPIVERIVKTLLWLVGGYKIYVAGDRKIYECIKKDYAVGGEREFDALFMERVYEAPFEVIYCEYDQIPALKADSVSIGGHLNGSRIGFDAGGSDRKVSAVKDGEVLYSEEVLWLPKVNADPEYHYGEIKKAFLTAASKLDKVDAIGISSAGIYVDNKIMVASLFNSVPIELFNKKVKNMYLDIAAEIGDVPVVVANDGDVTALAGAMELNDTKILGVAMGTSEAAGYINADGGINGWLNELGFVPFCFNRDVIDEWSGDGGTGAKYLCQEGVIRLAELIGHKFSDTEDTPAKKLKAVQDLCEKNPDKYMPIFETMGEYLGYAIAYYTEFYDIKHMLVLGRVTSGNGGERLIERAKEIVNGELGFKINITMPDENNRRLGQSIVAASLPEVK